jgi:hypothetical protein
MRRTTPGAPRSLRYGALLVTVIGAGCARGAAEDRVQHGAEPAAAETVADSAALARALELSTREPGALRTVQSAPVHGRTGPGGRPFEVALRTPGALHARQFGTHTMGIALRTRTPDLSQYPCTSCHMGRSTVLQDERVGDAHQNIQPLHPRETGATCATCHAADDVELLALRSGEKATLDHAYRVCAQCHFQQADGWAAGAHGKRLDGWQGRRVLMGCTDCHDPHRPALDMRLPFRPPTLHRDRSRKP